MNDSLRLALKPVRASILLLACLSVACRAEDADVPNVDVPPVVGVWVQVYPEYGALDTLVLHADQTVTGSVAGLDQFGIDYTHWNINTPQVPDAFCVSIRPPHHGRQVCQAWEVEGDTLWLGDMSQSTFLRAESIAAALPGVPWSSPRRTVLGLPLP